MMALRGVAVTYEQGNPVHVLLNVTSACAIGARSPEGERERDFVINNLLVRIHFIIEMIWWTGIAPWELQFPSPGSLTSTLLV